MRDKDDNKSAKNRNTPARSSSKRQETRQAGGSRKEPYWAKQPKRGQKERPAQQEKPQQKERRLFAACAKGIEPVLAAELKALGMKDIQVELGGVFFAGGTKKTGGPGVADSLNGDLLEAAYRANLWLRTANRVLLPVSHFTCKDEDALYRGIQQLNWRRYLTAKMTLAVDANVRDSNIRHSKYAALKTKDAIVDQLREKLGSRPSVNTEDPDLRINIHIQNNFCTVSLDTSGDSLNRRGYRVETVEAPLRETLAAAIIEFTGWDTKIPFIDGMCGSGTVPIEAALKATNTAPGLIRQSAGQGGKSFGFERWLDFDKALWGRLIAEAKQVKKNTLPAPIRGYDDSSRAIRAAMTNAKAAGFGSLIPFIKKDLQDFSPPPGPGIVFVNPPYGERLGDKEKLEELYKTIGDVFKQKGKGYTGYVFTGNPDLAKHIGLKTSRRIVLFNGPIEARLLEYKLY